MSEERNSGVVGFSVFFGHFFILSTISLDGILGFVFMELGFGFIDMEGYNIDSLDKNNEI